MANSFIENANYVASLDNAYGDSASFTKTNISFRGSSADVKFSMSYYDNTDMKIKSVETLMQNALYSDLTAILTQFKNSIELIPGFTCSFKISNNNNAYLVSSISFSITSSDSEKKITKVNFNMTKNGIEIYDTYGKINNPIKILPHLALYDDVLKSSIININTFKDEILYVNSNIISINTVSDSISHILSVLNNIDNVNSVAINIVPNLTEILQADTNASIATTKANEASISASAALTSEINAKNSETITLGYKQDVQTMKSAVESIYDSFDDRFLGAFSVDPEFDNDGNPLIAGALYFNQSNHQLRVYDSVTLLWYSIPQIYLSALLDVQLISLTTNNILIWNGTKWSNTSLKTINGLSLIGAGDMSISAGGGYAANVYLTTSTSSTNASYKQLSYSQEETETILSTTVNNNTMLIEDYIFDGDVLSQLVPAGEWGFHFNRKVDKTAADTKIIFEIYKRSNTGVETVLFNVSSLSIENTSFTREDLLITKPSFVVNTTDRVGLKVYATTTRTSDVVVQLKVGNDEACYFNTPLAIRHNQLRARDEVDSHTIGSITGLQTALDSKADKANTYTKTEVNNAIAALVDTAPATLDTLNELAAALGDDPNFATTVSTSIGTKVTKNVDIVGGTATKVTYDAKGLVTSGTTLVASDIPSLDVSKLTTGVLPVSRGGTGTSTSTGSGNVVLSVSPTFIGTPVAPTAAVGTNTTQLATTAYVVAEINKIEEW